MKINFPLRFNILSIFIFVLVSTVAFILLYSYSNNSKVFLLQSKAAINTGSRYCIDRTRSYLNPAGKLSLVASSLISKDIVSAENWSKVETMGIDFIKEYPQLAMFNFGDKDGNFLMIKKMPDKTLATKIIDRRQKQHKVIWKYRNLDGKVIKTDISTDLSYDPRKQMWFKNAEKDKALSWSVLYFFDKDKKPGISASYPIINDKGEVAGVLGFDITLEGLSEYLKSANISQNAESLIINSRGVIIACTNPERAIINKQGKLTAARIDQLDNKWLTRSYVLYMINKLERFDFVCKRKKYLASYMNFPKITGDRWKLIMVVPEKDFTGSLESTTTISMIVSLIALVCGIFMMVFFSNLVSRPLTELTQETVKIKDFDLSHDLKIKTYVAEVYQMAEAIESMKRGLRAFQKYVPSSLVRELIGSGQEVELGGENREITLFFSDIKDFTPLSENFTPQELMLHLSEYLNAMTYYIQEHRGTVDKYIGDSIMAFWGAPVKQNNHAELACRAAVGCRNIIAVMNEGWIKENKPPLYTRIGIHSGMSVVGNLGSEDRMNYTAMGDCVNLASRLEGVNKIYGTSIIVSETTYRKTADKFLYRQLDTVAVKGKKRGIKIYELIDDIDVHVEQEKIAFIHDFEKGVQLYRKCEFQSAFDLFEPLQNNHPEDLSIKLYIERCENFITNPPPADWDGVFQIEIK